MSVLAEQRHTRSRPCEICGGHDTMPRGRELRCHGFTSVDGKWCFCSRIPDGAHHESETAAGKTWAHLLRDEPMTSAASIELVTTTPQHKVVKEYDYYNEDGELSFQVLRLEPKSFRQRRSNGAPGSWVNTIAGVSRTMYRRAEVLASEGVVFLTEGEKDADALYALGLVATTTSGGASQWKYTSEDAKAVLAGRDVCIVAHRDEAGRKYGAEARESLQAVAKSVRVVEVAEGNDAADWVAAGATAASFLELWTSAAEPAGPVVWITLTDMGKPLPPIEWACEELKLARGPVSCLAGYGYSGKTAIAQNLLLCLATGRPLFGLFKCTQMPVGWMDYEQGWRMSAGRLQRQARGMGIDLGSYPKNALRYAEFPDIYLDEKGNGVDKIAKAVDGMGLCLMDSAKALTPGVDENDSRIRIPFDALSRVTMKTGCIFLVIHHFGKGGGDQSKLKPLKERMRGSSALFDAMQTTWGLEAKDKSTYTRCELAKDRVTNSKGLSFGVEFVDDPDADAVSLRHLDIEQMRPASKAALFKANVLFTVKTNPGLSSVEGVRFNMGAGFRNLNDVRSAIRELEEKGQLKSVGGAYRAV